VKVAMWSYTAVSYAKCGIASGGCRMEFLDAATPMIQTSSPTVVPGGKLFFAGYLRGKLANQYVASLAAFVHVEVCECVCVCERGV
jgi:hypothetical protein